MRFDEWLQQRLQKELPGFKAQSLMTKNLNRPSVEQMPTDVRESAVMVILDCDEPIPEILLIKRSTYDGPHSAQMAFPGGKREVSDESLLATAYREAYEEIRLEGSSTHYIGALTPLYIPVSNFVMHPFVITNNEWDLCDYSLHEVESIHKYNFDDIFNHKEDVSLNLPYYNQTIKTIAYVPSDGQIIWGATAMVISELEQLYKEYIQSSFQ